jgi:hypothetical protein
MKIIGQEVHQNTGIGIRIGDRAGNWVTTYISHFFFLSLETFCTEIIFTKQLQ